MEINKELEQVAINEIEKAKALFLDNMVNNNNVWGHSHLGMQSKSAAMAMLSTKTGLYAKIPITCKADCCPYATTCDLLSYGLAPEGEKCTWETALIETRYAGYMQDYDLDASSFTDSTIISELINIDIMLERTKALMSAEQIPITQVVAGMTESGEEFSRPEVSKAYEIYERNLGKRERLLEMMLGTRKSRKGQQEENTSIKDLLDAAISDTEFIIEERPDNIK